MKYPSSVKEGGLVAQAVYDCPNPDLPIGPPYYEYRDNDDLTHNGMFRDDSHIGDKREEPVIITINATTSGSWTITNDPAYPRLGVKPTKGHAISTINQPVTAGASKTFTYYVAGRGDYKKNGNGQGVILVMPPNASSFNDAVAACVVDVIDDDNTAYIGARRGHPYGETWLKDYHCTGPVGCAWD